MSMGSFLAVLLQYLAMVKPILHIFSSRVNSFSVSALHDRLVVFFCWIFCIFAYLSFIRLRMNSHFCCLRCVTACC